MPALYLTLMAVLLAGFGARDQITLGAMAQARGRVVSLLVVGILSTLLTTAFAAFAAKVMLTELPAPARAIFATIALGVAGLESLVLVPRRPPQEPTHSLVALLLVMISHQITDAARFMVFGVGVGLAAPLPAGIGGAIGGIGLLAFAWTWPQWLDHPWARLGRRLVGALLLVVAIGVALAEFGIL